MATLELRCNAGRQTAEEQQRWHETHLEWREALLRVQPLGGELDTYDHTQEGVVYQDAYLRVPVANLEQAIRELGSAVFYDNVDIPASDAHLVDEIQKKVPPGVVVNVMEQNPLKRRKKKRKKAASGKRRARREAPMSKQGVAIVDSGAMGIFADLDGVRPGMSSKVVRLSASGHYTLWFRRGEEGRISEIGIRRGKTVPSSSTTGGTLTVSKCLTFSDPAFVFPRDRYDDYLEKVQKMDWGANPGIIEGLEPGSFFVAASGWGDGRYEVQAKMGKRGTVSEARVVFMETEKNESRSSQSETATMKRDLTSW